MEYKNHLKVPYVRVLFIEYIKQFLSNKYFLKNFYIQV